MKKSTILAYAFFLLSGFFSCPRSSVLFYCCFACISFVHLNIKRNQTLIIYLDARHLKMVDVHFLRGVGGSEKVTPNMVVNTKFL